MFYTYCICMYLVQVHCNGKVDFCALAASIYRTGKLNLVFEKYIDIWKRYVCLTHGPSHMHCGDGGI